MLIQLLAVNKKECVKLTDISKKILRVPITLSKDMKHSGWVVPRAETLDLIPKLSYENECDVIIDDIPAKARLSILFRLFFRRKEEIGLAEYLDNITTGKDAEIDMQILLNDYETFEFFSLNHSDEEIESLNQKFLEYKQASKDIENYLIDINRDLSKKILIQNDLINDLKDENASLSKYVCELEEKNSILEKKIKHLFE